MTHLTGSITLKMFFLQKFNAVCRLTVGGQMVSLNPTVEVGGTQPPPSAAAGQSNRAPADTEICTHKQGTSLRQCTVITTTIRLGHLTSPLPPCCYVAFYMPTRSSSTIPVRTVYTSLHQRWTSFPAFSNIRRSARAKDVNVNIRTSQFRRLRT